MLVGLIQNKLIDKLVGLVGSLYLGMTLLRSEGIIDICSVLMLRCIAIRPQLHGAVINFLHGCSVKRYGRRDPIMLC